MVGVIVIYPTEGTAQGLSIVNPDGSLSTIVPAADVPTGGAVAGAAGQNYMPLAFFPMQPGAYSQYPAYPPLVGPGTSPPIPFPFLLCPVLSPQGAAYVTVPYTVAPSDGPASPVVTGPSPISPAARNNPDMEALLQTLRRGHSQPQTPSHPESPSQSQMARRKVGSPAARSQRGELTPRGNMSGNNSRGTPQASPWPSTSTERVHVSDSSPTTTASEGAWTGDRSDGEEISRAPIVHLPQKAKGSASAVTPREHQIRHDTGDGRSGHEVCLHTAERSRPQSVLPAGQESSPDSVAGVVPVEPGRLTTLSDSESAISTAESLKETSAEEASTATNRDDDQQPTQTRPAASPDKEVVSKIVNVLRIKANKASCSGVRSTSGTAGELASQGKIQGVPPCVSQ
ncbi:hypothetical protein CBR_g47110 [Chara braunii]|uniref:Uncharacterized protein n=1 Tax=Chara braunii TaxID=69332 RepID=A0A388M1I9_CHABU|nr:hypothetical protein CBR_g47110 [Chara braunii]|eukprot:GBG88411.1 hypothetical protein CBR_g47110 [Chara braunii]